MTNSPDAAQLLDVTSQPKGDGALAEDLAAVDNLLADFLSAKERAAGCAEVALFSGWLKQFLLGGKRFRPMLCCAGWRIAGGQGAIPTSVAAVAASLELFHTFALIHDDVMDQSATRRGRPTMHELITTSFPTHRDPLRFGMNTAILLGDLAFGWSYDLLSAGYLNPTQFRAVWPQLAAMRTETMAGQYLDLLSTGKPNGDVQTALRIASYKTAKYTVERPLQVGSLLFSADPALLTFCSNYGAALGEAFQLRDELLGVFGDPKHTGKSVLDDIRDGKPTVLMAIAYQRAGIRQRRVLGDFVGNPYLNECGAASVRAILRGTGAYDAVEQLILSRHQQALDAIDAAPIHPTGAVLLRQLAATAIQRQQ